MDNFTIFYPSPNDVEYRLNEAGWRYENDRGSDFAYAHTSVIPLLFEYIVNQKRVPSLHDCAVHLWQYREGIKTNRDIDLARKRTRKLVMDFYREMHTFGMLAQSDLFGSVRYAKVTDIDLGVDYTATLALSIQHASDSVGIQSAMRAFWNSEKFTAEKERRRTGRSPKKKWDGPVYWLTNEYRDHVQVGGVWLFTSEHIQDLVDEITGKRENGEIAILTTPAK